ncbi:MAG: HAD family phosphatase [Proteobacteria bacterium]|nr:HAD family phosphatase [Pseudomonadota bacterium]
MTLPRAPRAVVFDLDGTLIDSEALVREAYFAISRQFGASMSDAQFLSLIGLNRDDNDILLRSYWGSNFPLEDFHAANRAFLLERVAPLKPGALELLDALDDLETPYALATSSGPPWVERHFSAYSLAHRFKAVITRTDCVNGKPHPEPYIKASAALGADPADVLALEDSHAGVRSAHAAGCMTIMIPDLLAPNDEMHATALRVVDSLHDVRALLVSRAPASADR